MPGCPYMDSLPLIIEVGIFMDVFHFWEGIIFLLKREQNISFQMLWIYGVIAIAWIRSFIFNNGIDQILDFHRLMTGQHDVLTALYEDLGVS